MYLQQLIRDVSHFTAKSYMEPFEMFAKSQYHLYFFVALTTTVLAYCGENRMVIYAKNQSSLIHNDNNLLDESIENKCELTKSDFEETIKHISLKNKIFYN